MKTLIRLLFWCLPFLLILAAFLLAPEPASTVVEISNVTPEQVAQVLCEQSTVDCGMLFERRDVKVWRSPESTNRPRAVFKYSIPKFLSPSIVRRDTVGITRSEVNTVIVSLRCEEKKPLFVILFRAARLFYTRDIKREHEVLHEMTRRLQDADKAVSLKGVSGWNPQTMASNDTETPGDLGSGLRIQNKTGE